MTNTHTDSPGLAVTITVLAVSSLTIMANATIAPSLPGLARAFADTPGIEVLAGAVLSLPSLAIVLTAGLIGWLSDRIDRRRVLIGAMVIYGLGGALGAVAETLFGVLVSRVLLGIGVAGVMTIATALAADLWQGDARARFMGRQGAAISAGGIVFLLAGGALAEVTWRAPFALYLVALPLAAVVWATLPKPNRTKPNPWPLSFPWTVFLPIAVAAFFAMVMFYLIPTRLPFLLAEVGLSSPTMAGIAIAAVTAASVPAALSFGRLRRRFSPNTIFAGSFLAMALGYGVISIAGEFWHILTGATLTGLGLGLVMPTQNAWVMKVMPEEVRGRAAGLLTTAVFAGQFASPFIAGTLAIWLSSSGVFAAFAATLFVVSIGLLVSQIACTQKAT